MPTKCRPIAVLPAVCVYYADIRTAVANKVIECDCLYTESIATNLDGEVVYKKTPTF